MGTDSTTLNDGKTVLRRILGARLTSVQFVLDYLILGFDEKGALTSLVWPELLDGGNELRYEMNGYRDRLCDLIGHTVTSVEITNDETIIIVFDDKSGIRIPLRNRPQPGERAVFNAPKHHQLYVW